MNNLVISDQPPFRQGQMGKLGPRQFGAMLFAVAAYGAFALHAGVGSIAESLDRFAWASFAAACGLASLNFLLRFLKWQYYLAQLQIHNVSRKESLLTFLSGLTLTITPGKVGEILKSLLLFRFHGVPIQRSAPIVVAERVTDLIGVVVLISLGSFSFRGGIAWALLGMLVVAVLLVLVAHPALPPRLVALLPRLPGSLGLHGAKIAPKVAVAFQQLRELTTPRRLVWPVMLSIVAWSLEGIALWVILRGLGQHVPMLFTAFFDATSILAGALTPLPAGLGVTDGLLKEQMVHIAGVPLATATAAMLLTRFATLWYAVAVGFVALSIRLRMRNE